ncbi:hypothetical protein TWF694_009762 [Orbilia ellipsospora]|uniref:Uncharacterized protein n=1 Tax=Orbilia ellipsospora TaxID=2528407 RepID=A0AAV9XEI9_9PEZI
MPFALPSIPTFRISWGPEVPSPPAAPHLDPNGSHSRRPSAASSIASAFSSRTGTSSVPKSPTTPRPLPSIAEVAQPMAARSVAFQTSQATVVNLSRTEIQPPPPAVQSPHPSPMTRNSPQPVEDNQSDNSSITRAASLKNFAKSCLNKPELKTKVAILLVWSIVFIVVLAIYLGLFMNDKLTSPPLQIALILITLMAAFFFFHSLVRVCLAVARPFSYPDEEAPRTTETYTNPMFAGMTPGQWGYAQPVRPIQVRTMPGQSGAPVEREDDGAPKDLPPPPPAYGFYRQTVRVNPDQFYWMRRSEAENVYRRDSEDVRSNRSSILSSGTRPPSYVSRHGNNPLGSPLHVMSISEEPALPAIPPAEPSPLTARLPIR